MNLRMPECQEVLHRRRTAMQRRRAHSAHHRRCFLNPSRSSHSRTPATVPHSFWSRLFGLCGSNRFQFWEEKVCGLTAQKASSRPVHWVWLFALPVHNLRRTCFRARTSRCLSANFFLLYSCRFFFSVKAFPEPQRSRIYPMRNPTPNSLYYPDFPTHFSDGKRKKYQLQYCNRYLACDHARRSSARDMWRSIPSTNQHAFYSDCVRNLRLLAKRHHLAGADCGTEAPRLRGKCANLTRTLI